MLENSIEFGSKFSHAPMRDLASFMRTWNMATQAFAVDANANDVQDTGTGHVVINGVHIASLPVDAALDISEDLQLTIWLTATAYTAVDMRYVENDAGIKQWYKCIASHTSSALNKPGTSDATDATWKTYWTPSTQTAEQASGDYIPNLYSRYYACLARADGVLTMVKAGDIALDADVTLEMPNFEPEMFVCIGTLLIDSAGFTLGTTSTAGVSTFAQVIGPAFPTGLAIDQN